MRTHLTASDRTNSPSRPPQQPASSLKPRPFNNPVEEATAQAEQTTTPDLQTQLEHGRKSANLLSRVPILQPKLSVGEPNDQYEQEADRVASQVMSMAAPPQQPNIQRQTAGEEEELQAKPLASTITPLVQRQAIEEELQTKLIQRQATEEEELQTKPIQLREGDSGSTTTDVESQLNSTKGSGSPLSDEVRSFMEPRFGADLSQVRVHTGDTAVQMNRELGAQAFTHGHDIYYGNGKAPSKDDLTAHELTHVLQQTGIVQTSLIQRSIDPTYDVTNGQFRVNATPGGSNFPIRIGFHPNTAAPYSNQIGLIQIIRVTNPTGANVDIASMPAGRGDSLRTTADATTGVEAGYHTDTLHQAPTSIGGSGTTAAPHQPLPPQYPFNSSADPAHPNPAQPNPATPGLSRPFSSGAQGAIVGYKRSNDPADIKAAELTDAPGYASATPVPPDIDFNFETVAKGEDVGQVYGSLKWNFQIRSGVAQNENASVTDAQSATFDSALERHRDFYVHEPVIFYFEFNEDDLGAAEIGKIAEFKAYLTRFSTAPNLVKVTPTGFADQRGSAAYNRDLASRRAAKVRQALLDEGIPVAQINPGVVSGETTDFTPDAITDQDSDANRRGNRRVVLTFQHDSTTSTGTGGTP